MRERKFLMKLMLSKNSSKKRVEPFRRIERRIKLFMKRKVKLEIRQMRLKKKLMKPMNRCEIFIKPRTK